MRIVYQDFSKSEKLTKEKYAVPDFIMMENASKALEDVVKKICKKNNFICPKVLIFCGKGNNGADGIALARRIFSETETVTVLLDEPKTLEASAQYKTASLLGVKFTNLADFSLSQLKNSQIIVDCIFGTGFHGEIPEEYKTLFSKINAASAVKVACDVPSGLEKSGHASDFCIKADFTVTMGTYKAALFSDAAKELCGKISVADLGIKENLFVSENPTEIFLIQKSDIKLPVRTKKASHKGNYGHTSVIAGNNSGAAILASEAALHFGSGLTSLVKTEFSNLDQFKINPAIMISKSISKKTKAVLIGSGLGTFSEDLYNQFFTWFDNAENPGVVIDADLFSYDKLKDFLFKLNSKKSDSSRIILTPHPKELKNLCELLDLIDFSKLSIQQIIEQRIEIGKKVTELFPNITLVMKSANTFIQNKGTTFIVKGGLPNLAKGGSGDLLAGLCVSLLAQGYDAKEAAITAVKAQSIVSRKLKKENFSLTPQKFLEELALL